MKLLQEGGARRNGRDKSFNIHTHSFTHTHQSNETRILSFQNSSPSLHGLCVYPSLQVVFIMHFHVPASLNHSILGFIYNLLAIILSSVNRSSCLKTSLLAQHTVVLRAPENLLRPLLFQSLSWRMMPPPPAQQPRSGAHPVLSCSTKPLSYRIMPPSECFQELSLLSKGSALRK